MNALALDNLMCVPPASVAALWYIVHPMIEAAYAEVDELMPADILDALTKGKLLLWVSAPGGKIVMALVTALLPRPSGLTCKLMVCGGSGIGGWIDEQSQIESYARAEGCSKLLVEGRPGWARVLTGYDIKRLVLEKKL